MIANLFFLLLLFPRGVNLLHIHSSFTACQPKVLFSKKKHSPFPDSLWDSYGILTCESLQRRDDDFLLSYATSSRKRGIDLATMVVSEEGHNATVRTNLKRWKKSKNTLHMFLHTNYSREAAFLVEGDGYSTTFRERGRDGQAGVGIHVHDRVRKHNHSKSRM